MIDDPTSWLLKHDAGLLVGIFIMLVAVILCICCTCRYCCKTHGCCWCFKLKGICCSASAVSGSARPAGKDKKKFTVLEESPYDDDDNDASLDDVEMESLNPGSSGSKGWGLDLQTVAPSSSSTSRSQIRIEPEAEAGKMGGILSALRGEDSAAEGSLLILVPPKSSSGEVFDAQWFQTKWESLAAAGHKPLTFYMGVNRSYADILGADSSNGSEVIELILADASYVLIASGSQNGSLKYYVFTQDSNTSALFFLSMVVSKGPNGKLRVSCEIRSSRTDLHQRLKGQFKRSMNDVFASS
jgi:hypothetical protein